MTPKWLLIVGLILLVVGATWFLHSVGMGGGSGSVLLILAGFCCLMGAVVLHLTTSQHEKSGDANGESL